MVFETIPFASLGTAAGRFILTTLGAEYDPEAHAVAQVCLVSDTGCASGWGDPPESPRRALRLSSRPMCGRYTLTNPDPGAIRLRFDLDEAVQLEEAPRFNIAPTDPVLAVRRARDGRRDLGRLRWGLVPGRWAQKRSGRPLINARAETIQTQPAFRESFRERRCLIPADGFYEWRTDEDGKQAIWISRPDRGLFAFAGLWAELEQEGETLHSTAIVTCEPNELIQPIHNRMPVVLDRAAEAGWLDPAAEPADLAALLAPAPPEALELLEVADHVNDVRQDGPHLLEPPLKLF